MLWTSNKTVELDKCIICDQDKGLCNFSRQRMVSGIIGNKLHVYGGSLNGQVLADILVIELGKYDIALIFCSFMHLNFI